MLGIDTVIISCSMGHAGTYVYQTPAADSSGKARVEGLMHPRCGYCVRECTWFLVSIVFGWASGVVIVDLGFVWLHDIFASVHLHCSHARHGWFTCALVDVPTASNRWCNAHYSIQHFEAAQSLQGLWRPHHITSLICVALPESWHSCDVERSLAWRGRSVSLSRVARMAISWSRH